MRAVVYTPADWEKVKKWLLSEFGLSNCFAWNLKENFGFTVREYSEWVKSPSYVKPDPNDMFAHLMADQGWFEGKYKEFTIRLDFDDEDERNMWLLRTPVPPKEF
jgi:hypothetical protein